MDGERRRLSEDIMEKEKEFYGGASERKKIVRLLFIVSADIDKQFTTFP
jgi:hypothetical protein